MAETPTKKTATKKSVPRTKAPVLETVAVEPHTARAVPYRTIITAIWLTIASLALLLLIVALRKIVFLIVLAAFIALVLNPAVTRLQKWRLKRGSAIALVVLALFLGSAAVGALIAAPLASQGVDIATNAPAYLHDAQTGHGPLAKVARRFHLEGQLEKSGPALSQRLSKLSATLLTLGRRIVSAAFTATIVLILAIFMLVEGPKLIGGFVTALPPELRENARRIGRSTSRVVSGYTTGVLIMAGMNGLVAGVALAATGTPFVIPLAVWAAIVDILPIVGGLFAVVPAALFAFGHSLTSGIIVVTAILLYQQIKNHLLYPVMVGRAVKLNSLLVLIAVLAGAEIGHIAGAILAIPIAGTLQTVVVEIARVRVGASVDGEPERGPSTRRRGLVDRIARRIAHRKGL